MGTALVCVDRPTDMKLMGSFRDFAKAHKNHVLRYKFGQSNSFSWLPIFWNKGIVLQINSHPHRNIMPIKSVGTSLLKTTFDCHVTDVTLKWLKSYCPFSWTYCWHVVVVVFVVEICYCFHLCTNLRAQFIYSLHILQIICTLNGY